jgi:hypothetical protein
MDDQMNRVETQPEDDGGCGGGRPGAVQYCACFGRGPGTGIALAGREGGNAHRLARGLSCAGEASLAARPINRKALESDRLKACRGEMLRERELREAKIAAPEARDPALCSGAG